MPEIEIDWARVAIFSVMLLVVVALGFVGYKFIADAGVSSSNSDSRSLAQLQLQLTDIEKRLDDLEKRRRTTSDSVTPATNMKKSETEAPTTESASNPPRPKYTVSPTVAQQPYRAAPRPDPAAAERLARVQQGIGSLQAETSSNQEAWQATSNRLADVAGELASQQKDLGAQRGQIIQNQDELNRFLTQTAHTSLTFELSRGPTPQQVGPVRLALRSSSDKSHRYTICVYIQDSCIETKDRVLFEVVQLAVSRDTAPLQLIVTKVLKNGIAGYLEVPKSKLAH